MKKKRTYLFLALGFWLLTVQGFSQSSTDEQLAFQYLQNKEFDKAVVYYEKFFDKKDGIDYYNPYLLCLIKLRQFDKAEKIVKRLIKQYPQNLIYLVDLGTVYKEEGNEPKARAEYEKAIKQLTPDQQNIFSLAQKFVQLQEWDHAINTYQKGKKMLKGFYPFSVEIADVYSKKGDIALMVNEYLSLLEFGENQMEVVQNGLQPSFEESADENGAPSERDSERNDIIRTEVLKKIQSQPDKIIYSELLIWFFLQEKNFNGAFIQSKALDKRLREEGARMMTLGILCISNEEYETGIKCFQYVIDKGKANYYYIPARMELLNVLYKKVTERHSYTPDDLVKLETNFTTTINEIGKYEGTAVLMKNLAHLQAFFLNKTTQAVQLLNEILKLPNVNDKVRAECKLELGDVFLMTGEVWDASLLYSQVELDFKHEPLGNEAKFRNAKVSYYNGEFKWGQAQLDVLKGSTQKLIANDAMELSLTISDNLKGENDSLALSMFAQADLLCFRNQFNKSLHMLDSIELKFPTTSLADNILYKKYQIKINQRKFSEASEYLQKLLDNYSFDILGDDAMFKLAELNEFYLKNPDKAKQLYEELLVKFPGSLYTVEARKRFRKLRGDTVN